MTNVVDVSRPTPFDALAKSYDETFTHSTLGTLFRRAARRAIDAAFPEGSFVLELGCGTGEDALHLAARGVRVLAIDRAGAMVEEARAKAERAGLSHRIEVRALAIEELASLKPDAPFTGVLSNFGALNCVENLAAVGAAIAPLVAPRSPVLLCLMGRLCPWEWAWFLFRDPSRTFRRLRKDVSWRGLPVRYPSIGAVRRALAPAFRLKETRAIGALLPPTYAEAWASRHPGLMCALDRAERAVESVPPFPALADHVLLELERS